MSLSKVTLTKSAPSVSLTKRGGAGGQLRVNLQWSTGVAPAPAKKGLFARLAGGGRFRRASTWTWPACGS